MLLADLPDRGAAAELALRLLDSLERPFAVGGVSVQLGASIGVALAPDHGTDVSTLVRCADVAMYEAKREHGRVRVYDASRDPNSPERLQRQSELRTAVADRRAGPALPAEDRRRRRRRDRRRGAGPLAAPASSACSAPPSSSRSRSARG